MSTWSNYLASEKAKDYFKNIIAVINQERKSGITIYPKNENIFNAFKYSEFDDTKVVILGQDPYHGPKQAHGLCFSVQDGVKSPPSLVNIFKELKSDLGITIPNTGCLTPWAKQGVLLLNTCLSVRAGNAFSHSELGWQTFTDHVIKTLNDHKENLVFILWGSPAQKKAAMINPEKHLILKSPHPSPLSAHRGFFGCKHFSQTNAYLEEHGLQTIDWQL